MAARAQSALSNILDGSRILVYVNSLWPTVRQLGFQSRAPWRWRPRRRCCWAACRRNRLLRVICPRRVPRGRWDHIEQSDGTGRGGSALPPESLLLSPPLHVHVEIAASLGPEANLGWPVAFPHDARPISDGLLDPRRRQAVSQGWVHWSREYGQLVLAPVFPFGGEWGGHLIFYFTRGHIRYAVTLHAWTAALRLPGSAPRVLTYQSGAALPNVIATLKTMVGSAVGQPVSFLAISRPRHPAKATSRLLLCT